MSKRIQAFQQTEEKFMMKYIAIVIKGNDISEESFKVLQASTPVEIERFDAITPETADETTRKFDLEWKYPWTGENLDLETGLLKSAYRTKNPRSRVACFLSHYSLWLKCQENNTPLLILEHDAVFTNEIDFDIMETKFNIVGINDPRGATRLPMIYHNYVQRHGRNIIPAPSIDKDEIPQGLAGNSAYIISPRGAKHMIDLTRRVGMWPNDALMCRQLVPRLGVTKKYYTKVQGRPSTTTG